jgi:hypothetical protein
VHQGYNLIRWSNGGMNFWAVSDLNLAELQQFVQLLQETSANTTNGSWWIVQVLSTEQRPLRLRNPTNGSWWMVQILSTKNWVEKIAAPTAKKWAEERTRIAVGAETF